MDIKRNTDDQLQEMKKKTYWNKRIVLVAEIALCIITGMLFAFGVYLDDDLIEGIFSNCFTALVVTLLGTIVSWNTETDVERTLKSMEEQTSSRIMDVQNSTKRMIMDLDNSISNMQVGLDSLNRSIDSFSEVLDIYNGKACTFCKNYIKDVKLSRKDCKLGEFFGSAKKSICILATNLESFVPYLPQFSSLAKKGINVRIATIDPNFARDFNIARVTGNTPPEKRWTDMRDSLLKFSAFSAENNGINNCFQVRTYSNVAPTLILIMVDNDCYVAYLLNGIRASDTIHFLFSAGQNPDPYSPISYFKRHFESIWSDAGTKECNVDDIASITYQKAER